MVELDFKRLGDALEAADFPSKGRNLADVIARKCGVRGAVVPIADLNAAAGVKSRRTSYEMILLLEQQEFIVRERRGRSYWYAIHPRFAVAEPRRSA